MSWPAFMPRANALRPDGAPRRFGLEVEFSGLDLTQAVHVVTEALDGRATEDTEFEWTITQGDRVFRLERDVTWLKAVGERAASGKPLAVADRIKRAAAPLARLIMPLELVAPPLTWDELPVVDELVTQLGMAGAVGTDDRAYYAFGLHLNAELWDRSPRVIANVARAFGVLQRYLVGELHVDLARRLTPYITLFPDAYLDRLFDGDAPDAAQLTRDYLEHNPTRGRALDLLVILAMLDEDAVRAVLPDEKINARWTYHYRLPDSRVGEPGWTPSQELRSWALIEHLATDQDLLDQAIASLRTSRGKQWLGSAEPAADAPWLAELRRRVGLP